MIKWKACCGKQLWPESWSKLAFLRRKCHKGPGSNRCHDKDSNPAPLNKYQKPIIKVFYCSEIPQGKYSTPIFEVQQYQPCSNGCNETGFLCCSLRAISIANSEHSNKKMHNVLPSIFGFQYHTEYSYMFQSTKGSSS